MALSQSGFPRGHSREFLTSLAQAMGPLDAMAFDVDGTLAGSDSTVSSRTLRALTSLANAGIQPIIVTGRIWPAAARILHDAHSPGIVIASNGAIIGDGATDEILYSHPMSAQLSRDVIAFGRDHGLTVTLFLLHHMQADEEDFSSRFLRDANDGEAVVIDPIDEVDPEDILKIMYAHPDDQYLDQLTDSILERFPDFQRSLPQYFEIVDHGEGKEKALRIVARKLGWDLARVAGFGDGGNDVDWLRDVGWPIAMGNARDEVVEVSRAQIGHHADDAVADFIEVYLDIHSSSRPGCLP
ncbi:MAG: HAD family hydrolase [Actinomycetaceae bacterium]|nr:HAD family hydrolase [Actinomycetaceae bacterium]